MPTLDLLQAITSEDKLNPSFIALRDLAGYAPARAMIRSIWKEFQDKDGNFVEQFQTTGFDARIWELFLFALFWDRDFEIDNSHQSPDFMLRYQGLELAVEAVTVNPTRGGSSLAAAAVAKVDPDFRRDHAAPIKLGSALYSKLQKRYWELPHLAGRPFLLAIQDFHEPGSLLHSDASLWQYLYGFRGSWHLDGEGELHMEHLAVAEHTSGAKTIPSGFFNLPDTERISGVLFANSGTLAKFNRLGFILGYGKERIVSMQRAGLCYDHRPNQPNPLPFHYDVGSAEAPPESWSQGVSLFHNPNALHPLPVGLLPFAYHSLDAGLLRSYLADFHPFVSETVTLTAK